MAAWAKRKLFVRASQARGGSAGSGRWHGRQCLQDRDRRSVLCLRQRRDRLVALPRNHDPFGRGGGHGSPPLLGFPGPRRVVNRRTQSRISVCGRPCCAGDAEWRSAPRKIRSQRPSCPWCLNPVCRRQSAEARQVAWHWTALADGSRRCAPRPRPAPAPRGVQPPLPPSGCGDPGPEGAIRVSLELMQRKGIPAAGPDGSVHNPGKAPAEVHDVGPKIGGPFPEAIGPLRPCVLFDEAAGRTEEPTPHGFAPAGGHEIPLTPSLPGLQGCRWDAA